MEGLVKGDIVVLPFPYSDLTGAKRRPALVAAVLEGEDAIFCLVTSKIRRDAYSVDLTRDSFACGGLAVESEIRPNRLFTAESSIVLYKAGTVKSDVISKVEEMIVSIFTA